MKDIDVPLEECKKRYLQKCEKQQKEPLLNSFDKYAKQHEAALNYYKSLTHKNFKFEKFIVEKELLLFNNMKKEELLQLDFPPTENYMKKLEKWGIF